MEAKQVNLGGQFYNPYGFVPLSEHVFNYTEDERKRFMFAHDVPFEQGISGKILVKFKAKTPFCVKSVDKDNCHVKDKYFIPSTSIKGMVRAVFDIITLSNIKNGSNNSRFSMRDLRSKDYALKEKAPQSGFLILLGGNYYIIPCVNEMVSYKDIEYEEGVDVRKGRTAKDKYKMLKGDYVFQTVDNEYHYWLFSGFMSNKKHEYDFTVPTNITQNQLIPLTDSVFEEFRFIHEKENKNVSWAFWKSKMKTFSTLDELKQKAYRGLAPCFYREQVDENGKKYVRDLGFSHLYRIPYQKKIHDCLPSAYNQETFDMSQALFGFVATKGNRARESSLRGRVRFSNAFIENAERGGEQTFILGSPKPTYYPFYLQQQGNSYNTYLSDKSIIAGWKRYLLHAEAERGKGQGKKSESSFVALKAGAIFTTEINVHNLLPYEVGALLAALTFCNHRECFHSLGYAKPFGYGKMQLVDCQLYLETNAGGNVNMGMDTLMEAFYKKLCDNAHISSNVYQNYLSPLYRIASGNYTDRPIRYPRLDNFDYSTGKKKSEFDIIKNERKSLNNFTPIK